MKKTLFEPTTVLTYGPTGAGKSAQGGLLAQAIFKATGLKTRLYLTDNGSEGPWQPFIRSGIVELIDLRTLPHAFLMAQEIAAGKVPRPGAVNPKTGFAAGKWEKVDNANIGLFVYDSLTSLAAKMLAGCADKAAVNVNIGGGGAANFTDGDIDWGGAITLGSNNMTHYQSVHQHLDRVVNGLAQLVITEQAMVYCTAGEERGESDTSNKGNMIGPQFVGKAYTSGAASKFGKTFHMSLETLAGKEPIHRLWTVTHPEKSAANMLAVANRRLPMPPEGLPVTHPILKAIADLPVVIEPASVVKALTIIDNVSKQVEEVMKA